MILVDANILLYAKIRDYPQHSSACSWLEGHLNGNARVGLPWQTLTAFMRIATNSRLFPAPMSVAAACDQVNEWLSLQTVWVPTPTERHAEIFLTLVRASGAAANLVTDAHLAALAIEHGLELASCDGDFARFSELRWNNPIANS